ITYGASEGRGTVCVGPDKQALAIRSHFFEFVPEEEIDAVNPQALTAEQVEVGKNYYILFTTSAGLFRYNLHDIVKVVGWYNQTPLLEFQHKGGNISSFTGEKVTESQVTAAASATIAATAASLRFFTVIPQFRPEPHYEVWAEFDGTPSTDAVAMIDRISKEFDLQLAEKNIEYKTKRDSQRLTPAVGRVLPTGTYDELRRNLVSQGVPDAQIKVSHLNPKAEVRQYLESQLLQPAESGHR
ncbi:MAG TPA: GH3 auxin-responsive promoter family protein, partial [Trichormus sp.]